MKMELIGIIALAAAAGAQGAAAAGPGRAASADTAVMAQMRPEIDPGAARRLKARPRVGKEDCVSFNNRNVELKRIRGRWKIVEGDHWIADFGDKSGEAKEAFGIVRRYGFNRQCFVGRPGPSMTYWKRGRGIPAGPRRKEDCVGFNPANVQVKRIQGRWKIVEGSHWISDFGGKRQEAFKAYAIVKRYRLSKQCFVGRPAPSMTYWLR